MTDLHLALALVILLAGNILDTWSTRRLLAAGGRELNPIARAAIERLGVVGGLVAVKIPQVAIVAGALMFGQAAGIAAAVLLGVTMMGAGLWNMRQARKDRSPRA